MAQGGSRRLLGEVVGSERSIGQYAGGVGEGDDNHCITLTLGLGINSDACVMVPPRGPLQSGEAGPDLR
jgi:hypothetical protein